MMVVVTVGSRVTMIAIIIIIVIIIAMATAVVHAHENRIATVPLSHLQHN